MSKDIHFAFDSRYTEFKKPIALNDVIDPYKITSDKPIERPDQIGLLYKDGTNLIWNVAGFTQSITNNYKLLTDCKIQIGDIIIGGAKISKLSCWWSPRDDSSLGAPTETKIDEITIKNEDGKAVFCYNQYTYHVLCDYTDYRNILIIGDGIFVINYNCHNYLVIVGEDDKLIVIDNGKQYKVIDSVYNNYIVSIEQRDTEYYLVWSDIIGDKLEIIKTVKLENIIPTRIISVDNALVVLSNENAQIFTKGLILRAEYDSGEISTCSAVKSYQIPMNKLVFNYVDIYNESFIGMAVTDADKDELCQVCFKGSICNIETPDEFVGKKIYLSNGRPFPHNITTTPNEQFLGTVLFKNNIIIGV